MPVDHLDCGHDGATAASESGHTTGIAAPVGGHPEEGRAPTLTRPALQQALRACAYWRSLAKALQTEQVTDNGRAAMQRLDREIERFAGGDIARRLPAVAVECTAEILSKLGNVAALHLGHDQFMALRFNGDEAGGAVDGDHGGDGHVGGLGGTGAPSVAQPAAQLSEQQLARVGARLLHMVKASARGHERNPLQHPAGAVQAYTQALQMLEWEAPGVTELAQSEVQRQEDERTASCWALIDQLLASEQPTRSGQIALQRIQKHVNALAGRRDAQGLPAVLSEVSAQHIADLGDVTALYLGDRVFTVAGLDDDDAAPQIDLENGANGHAGCLGDDGAPSVAQPAQARRLQRTLTLSNAYEHHGWQDITVFGPSRHPVPSPLSGRCGITLDLGSVSVHLNPTPAEMRQIAEMLIEAAGS